MTDPRLPRLAVLIDAYNASTILDALNLYNDWKFRQKAEKLADQLKWFEMATSENQRKQTEYRAAVANIFEKAFRLEPN